MMMRTLTRDARTVVVAAITSLVVTGVPVMAAVNYALNADKVDGKHAVGAGASKTKRAGKLVATNGQGVLPNAIIKKAPDADKLDGVDSTGFVTPSGTILWNVWDGWVSTSPNTTVSRDPLGTNVNRANAGTSELTLRPTIPSTLFGKRLRVTGVEFCYDAGNVGEDLTNVELRVNESTMPKIATGETVVQDSTSRNTVECRTYTGTPRILDSDRYPLLEIDFTYDSAGICVIERTTFLLEATNQPMTP
jgi:hypothetical protein